MRARPPDSVPICSVFISCAAMRAQIRAGILVPDEPDPGLAALVRDLRDRGERVVVDLTAGKVNAADQQCDRMARLHQGNWEITEASK